MTTGTATMVPGYTHLPGHHCGSTALRNLMTFHGRPITEEMAFGLGAGACFFYAPLPDQSPSRFINGRTARLEENFFELTGAAIELSSTPDSEQSWRLAREAVDSGRPALLLTDLYYLDHYGTSAHFPGHAVVLAGYDDEVAYLSDTGFEELQTTRLENLAKGRHAKHPAYPLDGHMFTAAPGVELGDPSEAAAPAIGRAARLMLEPELGEFQGLPALRKLAAEAPGWPEEIEDWQWCARFSYQVIERRGTGGGNFRLLYSRFLEEAGYAEAELAATAAERWTAAAQAFHAASERDDPDPGLWRAIGERLDEVTEAEGSLWTALEAEAREEAKAGA